MRHNRPANWGTVSALLFAVAFAAWCGSSAPAAGQSKIRTVQGHKSEWSTRLWAKWDSLGVEVRVWSQNPVLFSPDFRLFPTLAIPAESSKTADTAGLRGSWLVIDSRSLAEQYRQSTGVPIAEVRIFRLSIANRSPGTFSFKPAEIRAICGKERLPQLDLNKTARAMAISLGGHLIQKAPHKINCFGRNASVWIEPSASWSGALVFPRCPGVIEGLFLPAEWRRPEGKRAWRIWLLH